MFTAYVDEREFGFVSDYKCDFICQAAAAVFVSWSSESNAEQALVAKSKSCSVTMCLCFVFNYASI